LSDAGARRVECARPNAGALVSIGHWRDKPALARFAADGRGFGDSDGGFGITYPSDLDAHDRGKGVEIPDGHVLAYGFWGNAAGGYEVLVPEPLYRHVLAEVLECMGLGREAAEVRSLGGGSGVG
jgi:hypothetical protein